MRKISFIINKGIFPSTIYPKSILAKAKHHYTERFGATRLEQKLDSRRWNLRFRRVSRRFLAGFSQASRRFIAGFPQVSRRFLAGFSPVSRRPLAGFSPASRRFLAGFSPAVSPAVSKGILFKNALGLAG